MCSVGVVAKVRLQSQSDHLASLVLGVAAKISCLAVSAGLVGLAESTELVEPAGVAAETELDLEAVASVKTPELP